MTYAQAYYQQHKEEIKARSRAFYYANRNEYIRKVSTRQSTPEGKERRRQWRMSKGVGAFSASTERWRQNNPEQAAQNARLYVERRRIRKAGAKGSFTLAEWRQKVLFHGWRCIYCHKELDNKTLTIEHRIPLHKGGNNWLANCAPACLSCNCRRIGER